MPRTTSARGIDGSLTKPLFPRAFRLALALCSVLAGGLLSSGAQAFADEGYRQVPGPFEPLSAGVTGLALDNSAGASAGDVYVVAGKTIDEFRPDGALVRSVELAGWESGDRSKAIAVDSSGTSSAGDVYVTALTPPPGGEPPGTAIPTRGTIYKLGSGGTAAPWVTGLSESPSGLAVGPSGEVYVTESGSWTTEGPLTWHGDGVLEFSSSGTPLNDGKPIVEGFDYPDGNPESIAVDSHGDLYVTNCSPEMGTVEFTPLDGGGFSAARTIDAEPACGDEDVAVDSRTGDVFIIDGDEVRVFDSSGTQIGGPALGSEVQGSGSEYQYVAVGESEATGDLYAVNAVESRFGQPAMLEVAEPGPEPPTIASESVGVFSVTEHEATLEAQINPRGLETTYDFFADGEQVGLGHIAAGDSDRSVSVRLSGLENHSHTYWVVATSSAGTSKGRTQEFVTDSAASPVSETGSATNVTEHEATLSGIVNKQDAFEAEYVFEYGTTTAYGASAPTPPGAIRDGICGIPCEITTPQPVSETLTGLEPGTTYHYRLVAGNGEGTGYGEDATFTTQGTRAHPLGGEEKPPSGGSIETPPSTSDSGHTGASSTPTGSGGSSSTPATTPLVSQLGKAVKPKALTRAQKLAEALKQCKKDKSKTKRAACQKHAYKAYATTANKASKQKRRH